MNTHWTVINLNSPDKNRYDIQKKGISFRTGLLVSDAKKFGFKPSLTDYFRPTGANFTRKKESTPTFNTVFKCSSILILTTPHANHSLKIQRA